MKSNPLKRIAIPTGRGYAYYEIGDIIRVEAAKNYSNVYIKETKKPILVSKNLKQFQNLLSKYGFLRVHNAHLVNSQFIKEYIRQDGGAILLTNGLTIFVGASYRQLLIESLDKDSENI